MKPIVCLLAAALPVFNLIAGETVIKDKQGMDCFVYTPDPIDPAKTYQLVVGVHGAAGTGDGAADMKDWAHRGDVIVMGPTFQKKGTSPYQDGNGAHAEKLIDLFETLKKATSCATKCFYLDFPAVRNSLIASPC